HTPVFDSHRPSADFADFLAGPGPLHKRIQGKVDTACVHKLRLTHFPARQTSASVSGRGVLPSMSAKPYSLATAAATHTFPVWRSTSGSAASAATARPMNSGDSELLMSSHLAASITFSVRTSPGYSDTTATPKGWSSTAMSA